MMEPKLARRSSFGIMVRKRFSDITNLQPLTKIPGEMEIHPVNSASEKGSMDQILKENRKLMELVEDKNKIIQLTGVELQKLKVDMQKMQLQNWNLAQSNSHILAELNLSRNKLRSLQHELACKDALLKVKNMDVEKEEKVVAAESSPQPNEHEKPRTSNRRQPPRSRSMGASTSSKQGLEKERTENKRRCVRKQCVRSEPSESLFEIQDVGFQAHQIPESAMEKTVDGMETGGVNSAKSSDGQVSKRSSIGRPLRKAAEKVQSYKEVPLNTKMRRNPE